MNRYTDTNTRYVCALFDKREKAVQATRLLREQGLQPGQLYLYEQAQELLTPGQPPNVGTPIRGLAFGAVAGALFGVALGVVLTGPLGFAAVGGLTGAMFGAGSGALFGGLGGSIVGNDVPHDDVQAMAAALDNGNTLLVAEVVNPWREHPVRTIMRRRGGAQIITV